MTKTTSIVSLFIGIALFASTIGFTTSNTKSVNHQTVSVEGTATTFESLPTIINETVKVTTNRASKKVSKVPRAVRNNGLMTVSYVRELEQGGSPLAKTVKVIERF
jgi:hypothetical protein